MATARVPYPYIVSTSLSAHLRRDMRGTKTRAWSCGPTYAEPVDGRTDRRRRGLGTFCIMATGCLSTPYEPDYPGLEEFRGDCLSHASRWPHEEVDLSGKRVGIIGTGATAIQRYPGDRGTGRGSDRLPAHFANYSIPGHNRPSDPEVDREFKTHYAERRERARGTFARNDGIPAAENIGPGGHTGRASGGSLRSAGPMAAERSRCSPPTGICW